MARKKRTSKAPASSGPSKADTIVRTYRFQKSLYDEFEEFCARNLMNPKLVIEASILHFMEADTKVRAKISERHLAVTGRE